jgi:hypothetical protein
MSRKTPLAKKIIYSRFFETHPSGQSKNGDFRSMFSANEPIVFFSMANDFGWLVRYVW